MENWREYYRSHIAQTFTPVTQDRHFVSTSFTQLSVLGSKKKILLITLNWDSGSQWARGGEGGGQVRVRAEGLAVAAGWKQSIWSWSWSELRAS